MKHIAEALRAEDPIAREGLWDDVTRERTRRAIVNGAHERRHTPRLTRRALLAAAASAFIVISAGAGMLAPRFASAAAIRVELRLAERQAAPGLVVTTVEGTGETIYLHAHVLASNDDIRDVRVIEVNGAFGVAASFAPDAARRLDAATRSHLGGVLAILLDGRVVAAPIVRSPVSDAAVLVGAYTREDAERIADGIQRF